MSGRVGLGNSIGGFSMVDKICQCCGKGFSVPYEKRNQKYCNSCDSKRDIPQAHDNRHDAWGNLVRGW
jgi:hypothetical protein